MSVITSYPCGEDTLERDKWLGQLFQEKRLKTFGFRCNLVGEHSRLYFFGSSGKPATRKPTQHASHFYKGCP